MQQECRAEIYLAPSASQHGPTKGPTGNLWRAGPPPKAVGRTGGRGVPMVPRGAESWSGLRAALLYIYVILRSPVWLTHGGFKKLGEARRD